jgi:hypothetical protein
MFGNMFSSCNAGDGPSVNSNLKTPCVGSFFFDSASATGFSNHGVFYDTSISETSKKRQRELSTVEEVNLATEGRINAVINEPCRSLGEHSCLKRMANVRGYDRTIDLIRWCRNEFEDSTDSSNPEEAEHVEGSRYTTYLRGLFKRYNIYAYHKPVT